MPTSITMQMAPIKSCNATDCSYNKSGNECHAMAITVGGPSPDCDTFMRGPNKGGVEQTGAVGACKVNNCKYNRNLECSAGGVDVVASRNHALCHTFSAK